MNTKKAIKITFIVILAAAVAVGIYAVIVDLYIRNSADERMLTVEQAGELEGVEAIVVLGCKVHPDGRPSDMLADRVSVGCAVYKTGVSGRLFMSGDHLNDDYDEVGKMRSLAMEDGVPEEEIELDGWGLSTYDSMWRLKNVYGFSRVIIITQEFHLARALYDAEKMGLDAYGVKADLHTYGGMYLNNLREVLARNKDFLFTAFSPEPYSTERYPD
ncbi:MAG: YdcF family protein [Clostridia bacterium]|nr:YdcF family protein [Clostridia bacterium]